MMRGRNRGSVPEIGGAQVPGVSPLSSYVSTEGPSHASREECRKKHTLSLQPLESLSSDTLSYFRDRVFHAPSRVHPLCPRAIDWKGNQVAGEPPFGLEENCTQ